MAIHSILRMGDPRLLQMAQPVTDQELGSSALDQLIIDLFDTMHAYKGAGIAAPQIGVSKQLVIFGGKRHPRYPDAPEVEQTVLINPTIQPLVDALEEGWEGCLSVPGLRGLVPRYSKIRYTGLDSQGRLIDRVVEGFHARVVQHECDHLIGRLYPTRMRDLSQLGFIEELFPGQEIVDD